MIEVFSRLESLKKTSLQEKWRGSSDAILLHTRGKGLDGFLKKYRPNEDADTLKYRLENSYLYTRDSFIKAIDGAKKAVAGVGISYDVSPELNGIVGDKLIQTPLATYNVEQYLISIFQEIAEYPNAHLVWLPKNKNKNFDYTPPEHPAGKSNTEKVDFEPLIVKDVIYFDSDSIVWKHGTWSYMHEGKPNSAEYFMGADITGYYRYIPIRQDKGKVIYELEPYYTPDTGIGQRPSRALGGDLSSVEIEGVEYAYYESFFANAAEFGKDFLSSYSDFKAVYIKNNFPIRVFNDSVCGTCNGKGETKSRDLGAIACGDCGGSGKTFTLSPYGDVMKQKTGRPDQENSVPFVEYFSSGSELLKFGEEFCFKTLMPKVDEALCLNYVRTAQSGTAKEEDKESYYALMNKIVENYIELMEFSLRAIQNLVIYNPKSRNAINVYSQRSVRASNTFELISQISNLNSSDLPSQMKAAITKQYLSDVKDDFERKTLEVIADYDVLFGKSEADILQLSASVGNPITSEDMQFNLRGRFALNKLVEKYGDEYLYRTNEELYNEALIVLGVSVGDEDTIEDVLDSKIDVEAEAKAKLKGTVGGVQGIIQINQAVASNQMTEASAEKLLQEIYGFSEDVAKSLIEKVNITNDK